MPSIIEESQIDLQRMDLSRRSPIAKTISRGVHVEPERASGVHLSGVLRYVAVTSGLLKEVGEIDEEAMPLRMALGLAWEEFAVSLYPEIEWQPGEMITDGIAMNCDGHSCCEKYPVRPAGTLTTEASLCLEEFKLTWKKAKSAEELLKEQWYWMQQGRGYCWGYDARLVRWHVCFVNGDYRGSGPVYRRYLIQFSDADVESTRKMVMKYSIRAKAEG